MKLLDKNLYISVTNKVNMQSVTEVVKKFLDYNPCIRRDLSRKIINTRALARYIKKEKNLETKIDAIISAIRRYELEHHKEIIKNSLNAIKKSPISTRGGLANVAITKDEGNQEKLSKIFSLINYSSGDVLRISQADGCMKILIDEKNLQNIKKLFSEKKIIKIDKELAELNIHFPVKASKKVGVVGVITNELAINGVNVIEIISCSPEILFFVHEKDLTKAHQIIYRLCHE